MIFTVDLGQTRVISPLKHERKDSQDISLIANEIGFQKKKPGEPLPIRNSLG
jgi:hypothetical protein